MAADWQVELRALRYFACVAEQKSFSRAATRLGIAQPALSRQIRRIETDLGVELLTRHVRGVELTEAGEILLRRAYIIFNQVQQTHHDVTAHAETASGVVTVGMPPTPGEFIAPPLLAQVRERYPRIELRLLEGFSGELEQKLLNHEIGVAVMHNPVRRHDIRIAPLLVERLCLVGPAGSLPETSYPLRTAAALPLILPSRPNYLRILLDDFAEQSGIPLNVVTRSDGVWTTKALVRAGHGYTMLTYGAVLSEVERGLLDAVPVRDPELTWDLGVAMRLDQSRKRTLIVIEDLIRELVGDLVQRGIWR